MFGLKSILLQKIYYLLPRLGGQIEHKHAQETIHKGEYFATYND